VRLLVLSLLLGTPTLSMIVPWSALVLVCAGAGSWLPLSASLYVPVLIFGLSVASSLAGVGAEANLCCFLPFLACVCFSI